MNKLKNEEKTTFYSMSKSEKLFRKMSKIIEYLFIVIGIVLLIMMKDTKDIKIREK